MYSSIYNEICLFVYFAFICRIILFFSSQLLHIKYYLRTTTTTDNDILLKRSRKRHYNNVVKIKRQMKTNLVDSTERSTKQLIAHLLQFANRA